MPNIRSAKKRMRQNVKRAERNQAFRSRARTAVRKARQLIERGDPSAVEAVQEATKALDKAASKGVIHKNNAARRKSRLMQALNKSEVTA